MHDRGKFRFSVDLRMVKRDDGTHKAKGHRIRHGGTAGSAWDRGDSRSRLQNDIAVSEETLGKRCALTRRVTSGTTVLRQTDGTLLNERRRGNAEQCRSREVAARLRLACTPERTRFGTGGHHSDARPNHRLRGHNRTARRASEGRNRSAPRIGRLTALRPKARR